MTTLLKLENNPVLHSLVDDFFQRENHFNNAFLHKRIYTNIKETEKEFILEFQAPGFKKEDFQVQIEVQTLKVSAEVKVEAESKTKEVYHLREFKQASFEKQFKLPAIADTEQIQASYENGILVLVIQKKDQEKPKLLKTIEIK